MVVDDDPYILIALRELFEPEKYKVLTVDKGEDCIKVLRNGFKGGVILMDIMMPGMDGWDTIEEILKQGIKDGNIISILTAKDIPDKRMDNLKEYIVDYITKPFDPDELRTIVKEYFNHLKNKSK